MPCGPSMSIRESGHWKPGMAGSQIFVKVYPFLKQCQHDLHFMKTRSFSPNLSKLALLTSAVGPCFHKEEKHHFKMNRF